MSRFRIWCEFTIVYKGYVEGMLSVLLFYQTSLDTEASFDIPQTHTVLDKKSDRVHMSRVLDHVGEFAT